MAGWRSLTPSSSKLWRTRTASSRSSGGDDARCVDAQEDARKKLLTPSLRRHAVTWAVQAKGYSQRHACRLVGLHRKTYRYVTKRSGDEELRRAPARAGIAATAVRLSASRPDAQAPRASSGAKMYLARRGTSECAQPAEEPAALCRNYALVAAYLRPLSFARVSLIARIGPLASECVFWLARTKRWRPR
jgi:hypothetical protein